MTMTPRRKTFTTILKSLSIVLLILMVLVITLTIVAQTSLFEDWLRRRLLSLATSTLNGELEIEKLNISLFSEIEIDNLSWQVDGKPFLSLAKASVRFNLLLFFIGEWSLTEVDLIQPRVTLFEIEGNAWNFDNLLRPSTEEPSPGSVKVNINALRLTSGLVDIEKRNAPVALPKKVKNIDALLALSYRDERLNLSLTELRFETEEPNLRFRTVVSSVTHQPNKLEVDNLKIETDSTKLISSIKIADFNNPIVDVSLTADPVALSEVRRTVPELQLNGHSRLELEATGPLEALRIKCSLELGNTKAEFAGDVQARDRPLSYNLKGSVAGLNLLEWTGKPDLGSDLSFDFKIRGQDIKLGELNAEYSISFGPTHLREYQLQNAVVSGALRGDSLDFSAELLASAGSAKLQGRLLGGLANPNYQVDGQVRNLNLQYFPVSNGVSTWLNFDFDAAGNSWRPDELVGNLRLQASESTVNDVTVDSAFVKIALDRGNVLLQEMRLIEPRAQLQASGSLTASGETDLFLNANLIDLGILLPHIPVDSLEGEGNVVAQLYGKLDSISVKTRFEVRHLAIGNTCITAAKGEISGFVSDRLNWLTVVSEISEARIFDVDSLNWHGSIHYADTTASFEFDLDKNDRIKTSTQGTALLDNDQWEIHFDKIDFEAPKNRWQLESATNKLSLSDTEIHLSNLVFSSDNQKAYLHGALNWEGENDFHVRLEGFDVSHLRDLPDSDIALAGLLDLDLTLSDSLKSPRLTGTIKVAQARFDDLVLDHCNTRLDYQDRRLSFEALISNTGQDSLLTISGFVPFWLSLMPFEGRFVDEPMELKTRLRDLDLSKLDQAAFTLSNPAYSAAGVVNLQATLFGTMDKPSFRGDLTVNKGKYSEIPFDKFVGNFSTADDLFLWSCDLHKTPSDKFLRSSGFLPLTLSLNPVAVAFSDTMPLEFTFTTDGLDLSFFQPFLKNAEKLDGTVVADLAVNGTLNEMRGTGPIRVVGGAFDMPELGTRYRNMNVALVLRGNELVIREFRMRSGAGDLNIGGSLSLSKAEIERFSAQVKAKNFQVMNNKKMRASVDADITLSGSVQTPQFGGELTVVRASIFYPAWFEEERVNIALTETPFFVIVEDSAVVDSVESSPPNEIYRDSEKRLSDTQLYQRIRGELTIRSPRNTWIRSDQTNIELSGELQLVKADSDFELFGAIAAERGFYELFGRRFQIREGNLTFAGGTELNPEVNVEAVYRYYLEGDTRVRHDLKVIVTGSKQSPQFRFMIDDREAEHQDVMGILLFGSQFEDLSLGQKNSLSEFANLEKRATGYLTEQLIRRLSRSVNSRLALDVMQIESGKNSAGARLRVGKYVTSDVFVTLSQDFGGEGDQRVELEYQLPRILLFNLLFQATREKRGATGLDLFWKVEW